jgi:hypothetical protein
MQSVVELYERLIATAAGDVVMVARGQVMHIALKYNR